MFLKGVFTTFVGLATIVGTYMYAVDNKWIDDVPDLRMASKTIDSAPSATVKLSKPKKQLRPSLRVKPQRVKRPRRRVAVKRTRPKRRTVSIFKAAKDIPHPNSQR